MVNLRKILALKFVILIGFTLNSSAQVTASANTRTVIVKPTSIVKNVDMSFGNISVQANAGGTVEISPDGAVKATGGITLPEITGSPSAAKSTIYGLDSYTYGITLPKSSVTVDNGYSDQMKVDKFTSIPFGTGILTDGNQELAIGATLNVSAGQAKGIYNQLSTFNVVVNYN